MCCCQWANWQAARIAVTAPFIWHGGTDWNLRKVIGLIRYALLSRDRPEQARAQRRTASARVGGWAAARHVILRQLSCLVW